MDSLDYDIIIFNNTNHGKYSTPIVSTAFSRELSQNQTFLMKSLRIQWLNPEMLNDFPKVRK